MKKLIIITLSIVLLCTAINITVAYAKTEPNVYSGTRTYILREYNGMVACFENNAIKPFLITDVRIQYLPEADKKLLADGIYVTGAQELSRALEDYRT